MIIIDIIKCTNTVYSISEDVKTTFRWLVQKQRSLTNSRTLVQSPLTEPLAWLYIPVNTIGRVHWWEVSKGSRPRC